MKRMLFQPLAVLALLLMPALVAAQEARTVLLKLLVPADAVVEIEGARTNQTGTERLFVSPALEEGKTYVYTIKVTWKENGKDKTVTEKVRVKAGESPVVNLRPRPSLDVPFVPTPQDVVEKMLELGKVTDKDVLYDLGCGDGRIVVTAAKRGARGVGLDIDPERISDSRENAKKNNVEDKVEFREGSVLNKIDGLEQASVITLYLLPDINLKLRPTLQKLKAGTRIVSHAFDMGDWKPKQVVNFTDSNGRERTIYLWVVGEEKKEAKKDPLDRRPDIHFVPTPQGVVDKMLELAQVKKTDLVYDLGCGDGRIVVTAAKKYGATAIGYDIDPERVEDSNKNVKKNKVEDKVTIQRADVFTLDLSKANVVTVYLLPELNVKLIPQLEKLKPGCRIVSHDFDMRGVKPDQVVSIKAKDDDGDEREHTIYLWTTPLKKEKD